MSTMTVTIPAANMGASTYPTASNSSGSRSPSPLLAPPSAQLTADRPLVKRHHTVQTVRSTPYPSLLTRSSPSSPTLPGMSPAAAAAFSSAAPPMKRPGAPRRAHSFCGDASTSTYALASTSAAAHLSKDKTKLVAPPLERSLSSMGRTGHLGPGLRPIISPLMTPPMLQTGAAAPSDRPASNSPPLATIPPPVPQILISPSVSPPRPSLATIQHSLYSNTFSNVGGAAAASPGGNTSPPSRASTYIATPGTPGPAATFILGHPILEEPLDVGKENLDPRDFDIDSEALLPLAVEQVVRGVSGMVVDEA